MKITVKQLRALIAEAIEAHPGVVAKVDPRGYVVLL